MKEADREVAAVAAGQYGAFSREQAEAAGLSEESMTRRVVTGRWEALHPAVYRLVGTPETRQQRLLAATLWAGPKSAISHTTGASLLQLQSAWPDEVHLTVPPTASGRADGLVVHRVELERGDVVEVDGIRCTNATRTILDCAGLFSDEPLEAAFEQARRLGLTSPTALARRAEQLCGKGRPGSARVRRLLTAQAPGERPLESRLEVGWLVSCARAGSRLRRVSTRSAAIGSTLRGLRCSSRANAMASSITGRGWRGSAIGRGSPRSKLRAGELCT